MKRLFLIICVCISMLNASFVREGETVIDQSTGYMWQDDMGVEEGRMDWESAQEYCEFLDLEGYRDWRLPKAKELKELAKKIMTEDKKTVVFEYMDSEYFWSSTVYLPNKREAWFILVDPRDTYGIHGNKTMGQCVRCVRGERKMATGVNQN